MYAEILPELKVVECGNLISASYGARLLAELGAEVIKVEEPNGDESRAYGPFPNAERSGLFLYLNRNKLGITVNLAHDKGLGILRGLLKECLLSTVTMSFAHSWGFHQRKSLG
jgi:crotonobetainyl-CoA:carnitine CoA-transferase CaiB-like acyl-CoA transferase